MLSTLVLASERTKGGIMYKRPFFVTNSSSTHSMLLLGHMAPPSTMTLSTEEAEDFGWEDFVLSGKAEKEIYMATTLYQNLYKVLYHDVKGGVWVVLEHTNRLMGKEIFKKPEHVGYLDHQSLISLPVKLTSQSGINEEFFLQLCDYVVNNPLLVIAGGNDNEEGPYIPASTVMEDPVYSQLPIEQHEVWAEKLGPRLWRLVWQGYVDKMEERVIYIPEVIYNDETE